jgi:hypothetical protein
VNPVTDLILLRKSSRAGNRTWGFWIFIQELWPLDHRDIPYRNMFVILLIFLNIFETNSHKNETVISSCILISYRAWNRIWHKTLMVLRIRFYDGRIRRISEGIRHVSWLQSNNKRSLSIAIPSCASF